LPLLCAAAAPAAAVAAERASLLDEIKRMVEQASASTEILNELILNKEQVRPAQSVPAAQSCRSWPAGPAGRMHALALQ
jgi:hypothetical protein